MRVPATAKSKSLLGGSWELCLPAVRDVALTVSSVGKAVESWQASIGLEGLKKEFKTSTRFRRWAVSANDADAVRLHMEYI